MATYTATLTRAYSVKNWNWPNMAAGHGYWSDSTNNHFGFIAFDIASMRATWNSGQRISSCSLYFRRSGGNWGSPRTLHCYASKINPASLPAAKPATAITPNRLTGTLYDIACPALTVNGQWITVTVPNALVEELIAGSAGTGIQLEYTGSNDYMFTGDSTTTNFPVLTINWYNPVSACGAPTSCSVNSTLAEGNVTLSWSGATNGTGNAISSYEIQYSDSSNNSTWGSWTALTTVSTTATSGSVSVSPPSTRGYYRRFQVRTRGTAGSGYYSGWKVSTNSVRKNTLPSAPTSFSASPATYSNENVTLSWSGAAAGTSPIKQYNIEHCTSTNGSTWTSWSALATVTSSSTSGSKVVTPTTVAGTYTKYRIRVTDTLGAVSSYKESNSIYAAITACGAPTACSVSSTLAEGNVTLSWSGASNGAGNTISSYEIQYSESADNANWGSWTALTIVSTTATSGSISVSPSPIRGNYRRFQVRARGTAGADYYSEWKASSNSVRKNTLPAAPASFTATPAVYEANTITLAWSGAVPGTSAIQQYVIQHSTSADEATWSAYETLATITSSATSGSYETAASAVAGTFTRYRISVTDTLGAVSPYAVSNTVKKNSPPAAPAIAAPKAGSATYNATPRFLITTGIEPDGQAQKVCVKIGAADWRDSDMNPELFSQSGYLGENTPVVFKAEPQPPSGRTVAIRCMDEGISSLSPEVSRTITVLASPFEEIAANVTPVKAAHIQTLRAAVNTVRDYYGLAAVSWSETVVAGRTAVKNWPYHITELRNAIEPVIALINGFDAASSVFYVPTVTWLPLGTGRPRADVMQQLHDLILTL